MQTQLAIHHTWWVYSRNVQRSASSPSLIIRNHFSFVGGLILSSLTLFWTRKCNMVLNLRLCVGGGVNVNSGLHFRFRKWSNLCIKVLLEDIQRNSISTTQVYHERQGNHVGPDGLRYLITMSPMIDPESNPRWDFSLFQGTNLA